MGYALPYALFTTLFFGSLLFTFGVLAADYTEFGVWFVAYVNPILFGAILTHGVVSLVRGSGTKLELDGHGFRLMPPWAFSAPWSHVSSISVRRSILARVFDVELKPGTLPAETSVHRLKNAILHLRTNGSRSVQINMATVDADFAEVEAALARCWPAYSGGYSGQTA